MIWLFIGGFAFGFLVCMVACFGRFVQLHDQIDYWHSAEVRARWMAVSAMDRLHKAQRRVNGDEWKDGA
jgi:hypothetical protein